MRAEKGDPAVAQFNVRRAELQALIAVESAAVEGLYVHVPFCVHKCHYCDFYSIVEHPDRLDARQIALTDRLIEESTVLFAGRETNIKTIFLGGGTPTLLAAGLWGRLLGAWRELGVLRGVREFTVEANPETVTPELCEILAGGGVNRMSMGAQTFQSPLLKVLERWHDPASVGRAFGYARAAGIGNLNLDLIFAIPGQTFETLSLDLEAALELSSDHISCYNLTYEPNTAMTQRLKAGEFRRLDESLEREMFERVMETLAGAGFEHYEISNWARMGPGQPAGGFGGELSGLPPGHRRCEHNLLYWRNGNWVGIGPSAASHYRGRRWKNAPHLGRYLDSPEGPPITDFEHLDAPRRVGEQLMMGLRLREGVSVEWVEAVLGPEDVRRGEIAYCERIGVLERSEGRLRLSRAGLFVADSVLARLL